MKYLITMNMPSAKEHLVHQVTVEHPAKSCAEMCEILNNEEFITGRLFYRLRDAQTNEPYWEDRGDIVLNSAHIGKLQVYIEMEKRDESYGHSGQRSGYTDGTRGPIRPRRGVF